MLDEHNTITLFFDRRINRFIDEFGSVRNDIHRIITPNQVMMFKEGMLYLCVDVTHSYIVELVDSEFDEDEDEYDN